MSNDTANSGECSPVLTRIEKPNSGVGNSGDMKEMNLDESQESHVEEGGQDNNQYNSNTTNSNTETSLTRRERIKEFLITNSLLIGIVGSIGLAAAYPPLGAVYLAPQITATYIAVMYIFLLSGISLKSSELVNALKNYKFNLAVQTFNFMFVSVASWGLSRFLLSVGATSQNLADGLTITSCLPMTINMVIVLTKSSGGDEASAVFNAAAGNLMGVFLTPALVLMYLGESEGIDIGTVFLKLAVRVLLPIFVGQIIQYKIPVIKDYVAARKWYFKKSTEFALIFIVYTVFCKTFYDDNNGSNSGDATVGATVGEVFVMVAVIGVWILVLMVADWGVFMVLYKDCPELRVFALFGGTHKTVAMGIPLITALYEGDSRLALYTLPLLVWHPAQLVIGSAFAPRLNKWVEEERRRLDDGEGVDDVDEKEGNIL
ncbi:hypothetical protein TrCOL_g2408 [Triparma columacea]|uniref:Uncharacterized protein n=1 Tax=Triparma columacea TaxID=722753 RepID=A0A9W7FXE8_9STRA|nr:hypothetical protein TrCOL_g2408 [Triparma columacea]